MLAKILAVGNKPAIRDFLKAPSPLTQLNASAGLQQIGAPDDASNLQIELWNANGSLLLVAPEGASPIPVDLTTEFKQVAREPFKAVGPLRLVKDMIVYPAVAAVKDDAGNPTGYLVKWRRLSANPDPMRVKALLGSEATLFLGNREGEVWTDLEKAVSRPPLDFGSTLEATHYVREGTPVMALGRPISGTPFFVVVEFPEQVVFSGASNFLRRLLIIDAVLLGFGILGAFALSREITRPLNLLTESATGISFGNYSGRVDLKRKDELGALGNAFDFMADKVRDTQVKLKAQVDALSDSEQRLHAVVENLSEGLIVSDLDGQVLNWNRAALEIHGFTNLEEGLLKLPEFTDIFELTDLDGRVLDLGQWPLTRIINGEHLHNLELSVRRLDKDWERVFNYGGSIVHQLGGRQAAIVTMSDITERKRAEEARRLLGSLVDCSDDAIITKTMEGIITSWNNGAEKLYGYSAEEAIGQSIKILLPADHADEVAKILTRLSQGETIDHFETERITKGGNRLSISLTISPIKDESGVVRGASTIARDISGRKLAEEGLQASEVRYRRLFESARDGILILNGDSGEIVDVNAYLIEILGFSKDQLLGKQLWEIGTFKDIAASKAAFVELQARDYVRYDDLPLESRDNIITHVEVVANGYMEAANRVVQCNIRDITERRLAEADLVQTNRRLTSTLLKLEAKTQELASMTQQLWQASKLATMGELAASVAHELNNPLATISLHTEMLVGRSAPDDPDLQSLRVIEQEVERMATLVSNLLLFSRRGHRQISTLDICEELRSSLDFIQYHLRSHHIDIVEDCLAALPAVEADRQQLRQVFLNLITNAGDAMAGGGTLTVRTRVGVMTSGKPAVVIEFSDTGTGVQTQDLPRLWEPFFTTKPEGKGTGLGLAICRRAVEEHRGTIEIRTVSGTGTTVRITLPASEEGIEEAA
jgi:PAS domain S-box-containing protein